MAIADLAEIVDQFTAGLNPGQQAMMEDFINDYAAEFQELVDSMATQSMFSKGVTDVSVADFPLTDAQMQALSETMEEISDEINAQVADEMQQNMFEDIAGDINPIIQLAQLWFGM